MPPIAPVIMPTWGLSMEEGKLVKWLVPEGAAVTIGTELAEIETSKITNVLEAAAEGILRRQVVGAGETRDCGALLGVIADATTDDGEVDRFVAERANSVEAAAAAVNKAEPRMVDAGNGNVLRCFSLGEGGTPAILLHGFGGDLDNWQLNQASLAAERIVHAIDLPGHGDSSKALPPRANLAGIAGSVLALMENLGIGRVHLVGHSLGGGVALAIAAAHPHRVASLALLAPFAFGGKFAGDYAADFLAARKTRDLQKVLARLFADPSRMSRDMVESVARNKRLDGAEQALAAIAEGCFATDAPQFDMAAIATGVPTAVIWGVADSIIEPPMGAPNDYAEHRLPGVGHMPHLEAAETVNDILIAHMRAAS